MEEKPSHSNRKRPFFEDEETNKPPVQKRVRFPKGKKVKPGDEVADKGNAEDDLKDPNLAAKGRAMRRSQITAELFSEEGEGILNDVSAAEMNYQDNENFVEDGIQIDPFNLDKEREEGYFDADGNFVEYVVENEIKDAWLDSIEACPKYTGGDSAVPNDIENQNGNENEDAAHDLSSDDIGMMKRRIANVLEAGETVLQALRRLKGTSNNRKEKMSVETKRIFDQLTEDADKLIQNGEYNVYHEKQEVFVREAEGYERLARARGKGTSLSIETSSNGADDYDMFGDDDEHGNANPSSDGSSLASGPNSDAVSQSSSDALNTVSETGALHNNFVDDGPSDYVYDEHSGYYYSSSLGYYYDPSAGLYCSAATGQWYSFNEDTGTYEEIPEVSSSVN